MQNLVQHAQTSWANIWLFVSMSLCVWLHRPNMLSDSKSEFHHYISSWNHVENKIYEKNKFPKQNSASPTARLVTYSSTQKPIKTNKNTIKINKNQRTWCLRNRVFGSAFLAFRLARALAAGAAGSATLTRLRMGSVASSHSNMTVRI